MNKVGRGNHTAPVLGGVKVSKLRPKRQSPDAWLDYQRKMVGNFAKLKRVRDSIQAARIGGDLNPHVKEAQAATRSAAKRAKQKSDEGEELMKSKRELKTFWRPRSMTKMPLTIAAPENGRSLIALSMRI